MNLSGVIQQLRATATVFGGNVAGAAAYASGVEDQVWLPLPAAYVVPISETSSGNEDLSGLQQTVTEHFGVIVCINNAVDASDRRGQAAAQLFRTIRSAVFSAILNWRPDDSPPGQSINIEARGIYYEGADLESMDRARLFWRFNFALDTTITDADGYQLYGDPLTDITAIITNTSGTGGGGQTIGIELLPPSLPT